MRYTRITDTTSVRLALLMLGVLFVLGVLGSAISGGVAQAGVITDGSGKASKETTYDPGAVTETPTLPVVRGPETKAKTPTEVANMTPISEQGLMGWERDALRDLANVLGWPTAVIYDTSGRLKVQAHDSETNWSVAHIRAFDFNPGAEAAFVAEQEDTRLAGFSLTTEYFYGYRAYSASLTDNSGTVVERRFRWLANTWILGVDLHRSGPGAQVPNPSIIASDFLSLAVRRGLPPPPNGDPPTPNPTWGLPPIPTPTALTCDAAFSDVNPNYWAYTYIKQLACEGFVSGYDDSTFRPENTTTRAQLVKMLVLSQRWVLINPSRPRFVDVNPLNPFYRYVETAAAHRLITGYADSTFRPNAYVTRAQVAKMLVLAKGWTTLGGTTVTLCDVARSHWAWGYIQTALQHGIFTGYGDNCFRPDLLATRAQLSKVLYLSTR